MYKLTNVYYGLIFPILSDVILHFSDPVNWFMRVTEVFII